MSDIINSACGWSFNYTYREMVSLIQERSGVDGTFLLVDLISSHLRQVPGSSVLLFATQRTHQQYISAMKKRRIFDNMRLLIVDMYAELYTQCSRTDSKPSTGDVGTQLLTLIRDRIRDLPEYERNLIVVDDLSFYAMVDPTIGENGLINFFEELVSSPKQHFALKVNAAECYGRLCATLAGVAKRVIILEPLPSGNFREVDGLISTYKRERGLRSMHVRVPYIVAEMVTLVYAPAEFGIKNL